MPKKILRSFANVSKNLLIHPLQRFFLRVGGNFDSELEKLAGNVREMFFDPQIMREINEIVQNIQQKEEELIKLKAKAYDELQGDGFDNGDLKGDGEDNVEKIKALRKEIDTLTLQKNELEEKRIGQLPKEFNFDDFNYYLGGLSEQERWRFTESVFSELADIIESSLYQKKLDLPKDYEGRFKAYNDYFKEFLADPGANEAIKKVIAEKLGFTVQAFKNFDEVQRSSAIVKGVLSMVVALAGMLYGLRLVGIARALPDTGVVLSLTSSIMGITSFGPPLHGPHHPPHHGPHHPPHHGPHHPPHHGPHHPPHGGPHPHPPHGGPHPHPPHGPHHLPPPPPSTMEAFALGLESCLVLMGTAVWSINAVNFFKEAFSKNEIDDLDQRINEVLKDKGELGQAWKAGKESIKPRNS